MDLSDHLRSINSVPPGRWSRICAVHVRSRSSPAAHPRTIRRGFRNLRPDLACPARAPKLNRPAPAGHSLEELASRRPQRHGQNGQAT